MFEPPPIHPDFRKLFFLKEGRTLAGPRLRNIWILVGIMFVTFVAIGFANGSLSYLKFKMDDPFINWVSIDIPRSLADSTQGIKNQLNLPANRTRYAYNAATVNRRLILRFQDQEDGKSYLCRGRTIELENPILTEIVKRPNLIHGRGFEDEQEVGIIVTTQLLRRLGYPEESAFIQMAFSVLEGGEDALLPLPIVAVVEKLPGKNDFATTTYFFSQRKIGRDAGSPFDPVHTRDLLLRIAGDEARAQAFQEALEAYLGEELNASHGEYAPYVVSPTPEEDAYQEGFVLGYSFLFGSLNESEITIMLDEVFDKLQRNREIAAFDPMRYYRYAFDGKTDPNIRYDRISVHFQELDQIRLFRDSLLLIEIGKNSLGLGEDDADLDIDLAQIEAKENYNFVTRLTRIISMILIGFSVLSICLFVSHMFRKHLTKISRNIGTFKAFGMDNQGLISIYLSLIGIYMLGSLLISLMLAWIFGSLGGIKLILRLVNEKLESEQTYFELFNQWTWLAIVLLLGVSFVVLYQTARSLLSRSPGDLIYNRL
jgi:hypothetical protein